MNRRPDNQHSLLDALLRDLGPALDEINATSLASADKKLLVRRLIESRLADVSQARAPETTDKAPAALRTPGGEAG